MKLVNVFKMSLQVSDICLWDFCRHRNTVKAHAIWFVAHTVLKYYIKAQTAIYSLEGIFFSIKTSSTENILQSNAIHLHWTEVVGEIWTNNIKPSALAKIREQVISKNIFKRISSFRLNKQFNISILLMSVLRLYIYNMSILSSTAHNIIKRLRESGEISQKTRPKRNIMCPRCLNPQTALH